MSVVMKDLDALGLDPDTYRVVLLLPLIEVAWADGEIQAGERDAILGFAKGNDLLAGRSHSVVEDWLTDRPSADYFERARAALVKLAHDGAFGPEVSPAQVDDVVEYCSVIASSAGGFMGYFHTSAEEEVAMRKIATHVARLQAEHSDFG